MAYAVHRPQGFRGKGDSHLPEVVRQLRGRLADVQRDFTYATLRLRPKLLGELAGILVDFAEDLHNNDGIWAAYERYNCDFFGTALPLTSDHANPGTDFHPDRFRHLLWVLYPVLIDGLVLSPTHQDLQRVAEASSQFLSDAFSDIPEDSGVAAFLGTPGVHGWDVKRKLIWLGTHSYMFRLPFARYMAAQSSGRADIGHIDDFVCQECTPWSGLGAIDILAGVLDISKDDRKSLRSWYERHAAPYKILSAGKDLLEAENMVSDQPYRISMDMRQHPFKAGQLVFGSLVPWRGEWYWSGEQKLLGEASNVDVNALKQDMKRRSSRIVCRYSSEYEAQVRQRASDLHAKMLTFYGKDLVVYADGLSMAADLQKELRWNWDSRPQQEVKEAIERHRLTKGRPEINIPEALLAEKDGLGVFLNPDEGKEIMTHFTPLVAGLKRKGGTLTEDEEGAIRGFFDAAAISPKFVRRMLEEYGDVSVRTAFLLKGDLPGYWLDYLLRSHKGHFHRKRYPTLSVV